MRTSPKLLLSLFNLVCDLYGWNRDPDSGESHLYLEKTTVPGGGSWWNLARRDPSAPSVPAYPWGCNGRRAADLETWFRGMMDAWNAQFNRTFSVPLDLRKRGDDRADACKVAVKVNAGNDANGNPRRGWIVYGVTGRYLGFVDEGYNDRGLREKHGINVVELGTMATTPGEYRHLSRHPDEHARPVGL